MLLLTKSGRWIDNNGNGCLYLEVRKMQGNSMIDKMCAVLKKETDK